MKYPKRRSFFSPYVPWRLLGILLLVDLGLIMLVFTGSTVSAALKHPTEGFYASLVMSLVGPTVSGAFCLKGALWPFKTSTPASRQMQRFSPLLWGLSGFVFGFGQLFWVVSYLLNQQAPSYPYFSHAIQLLTYGCFIGAVLLLPSRSCSLIARLCILLDSLIIMAAVATLCYYFILAPVLVLGHGTPLAKVFSDIYSVLDLLAMFSVLMVALQSNERALYPVLVMLGLATMLQFAVNILHLYEVLYQDYREISLANSTMILYGTLLVGAAQTVNNLLRKGQAFYTPGRQTEGARETDTIWKVLAPSVLVLIFGLLIFFIWLKGKEAFPYQISIVYIGGFVVLVLMILRQFLTMYQIGILQQQLRWRNNSLDTINAQLEKRATTDPLTGLPNHRALAERLDEALAEARTAGLSCSVIFMDIDHFKEINDGYGHLIGDEALSYFARAVTASVRQGDAVGRWGGEEFVALLPGASTREAAEVAERIRVEVSQRGSICQGALGLTCSLGVATYPQDARDREGLIRLADRAMYAAKRLGRNQTRTAREPLVLACKEKRGECEKQLAEASTSEVVEALLTLLEVRTPALSEHARRVAELAHRLALALGLSQDEARLVAMGGLLHELGNIAMPDEWLVRRASQDEERARYLAVGAEILSPLPALRPIAELVSACCERVDGSGYPARLKGDEIPLGARIIAVADAYETALAARTARRGRISTAAALKEIVRYTGSYFDARVISVLPQVLKLPPQLAQMGAA